MNKKLISALNKQIHEELFSSYLYLSMSSYFSNNNLNGFAKWLRIQADEERAHAMKIYDFLLQRGARVVLEKIDAPQNTWKSPVDVFENVLTHEKSITKMIDNLVTIAIDEKDYATFSVLQWFVNEQVEEEESAKGVLAKLLLLDGGKAGLLTMDSEMGKRE